MYRMVHVSSGIVGVSGHSGLVVWEVSAKDAHPATQPLSGSRNRAIKLTRQTIKITCQRTTALLLCVTRVYSGVGGIRAGENLTTFCMR